jgi:hypothetical protein
MAQVANLRHSASILLLNGPVFADGPYDVKV